MTAPHARILGLGTHVPSRVVTNHDLTQMMDTSHEWIVERSGVEERRWVEAGDGNYTMGLDPGGGRGESLVQRLIRATSGPEAVV